MKPSVVRSMSILFVFLLLHPTNLRVNSSQELYTSHFKYKSKTKKTFVNREDLNYKGNYPTNERQLRLKNSHKRKKESNNMKTIEVEFRPIDSYKKKIKQSDLLEDEFTPKDNKNKKNKLLKRLNKKQNLLMLAKQIKNEAKNYDLQIDKVILGPQVKKTMKDKKIAMNLSKVLNKKSINPLLTRLKKRIKKAKSKKNRKLKKNKKKKKSKHKVKRKLQHLNKLSNRIKNKKHKKNSKNKRRKLASMSGGSSSKSKGSDQSLEKFNFLPGYAGMPFPPFMMNGPHFHPPLNVTVNAIPNRDSKRELNPYEIEEENLINQKEALKPLNSEMKAIIEQIQNVSSDVNVDLSDEFEKIKNLYR